MRRLWKCLAGVVLSFGASSAPGGLVVTSYQTLAQTNGYAATSQTQYYAEQILHNVSPAIAEVSGDWTGPNANGTPNTWHFVGNARATSKTTITPDSYSVEAAAFFSYTLDTTAEFVDPASINTYAPGGTANYVGFFESDVSLFYSIQAQLIQRSRIRLDSFAGNGIFNQASPGSVSLSGTIPPGRYQLLVTSGLGLGNRPAGINHIERTGSLENLVFSVRVPEPSVPRITLGTWLLVAAKRYRMQKAERDRSDFRKQLPRLSF